MKRHHTVFPPLLAVVRGTIVGTIVGGEVVVGGGAACVVWWSAL